MNELILSLAGLGALSLTSLWLPLVVWTVVAIAVLLGLRSWHGLHPILQGDVRSALVLSLPAGILLAGLVEAPFSFGAAPDLSLFEITLPAGQTTTPVPASPPLDLPFWIGLATVAAGMAAFVRLGLLVRDALALQRLRRSLDWMEAGELERLTPVRTVRRARYAVAESEIVPMTFGFLRPVVVLPASLLDQPQELRMALEHEHVHVRRGDYLRQWIERFVAALFAVHPLVGRLCREIEEYREHACDAEVLATPEADAHRYALLLYRMVAAPACPSGPGLKMAGPHTNLKSRIRAMETPRSDVRELRRVRRLSLISGAILLLGVSSALAACDLGGSVDLQVASNEGDALRIRASAGSDAAVLDTSAGEPLYIVDGEPVQSLEGIAPEAIAHVEVLKGEAARALYGERGANGVVQVTTRQVEGTPNGPATLPEIRVRPSGGEPLYIVDGEPVDNIDGISPTDIERVDVLKGESATALYGERGANGVIQITRKR